MANHLRFVARTVMVQNGNVEAAYGALSRMLSSDGVIESVKRRRYYEKPCRKRERENYENCKRIYHAEMARKIPTEAPVGYKISFFKDEDPEALEHPANM